MDNGTIYTDKPQAQHQTLLSSKLRKLYEIKILDLNRTMITSTHQPKDIKFEDFNTQLQLESSNTNHKLEIHNNLEYVQHMTTFVTLNN